MSLGSGFIQQIYGVLMANNLNSISSGLPQVTTNAGYLQAAVEANREALERLEFEALKDLQVAWLQSVESIMQRLLALQQQILAADKINYSWLVKLDQYKALNKQIDRELQALFQALNETTSQQGYLAVTRGIDSLIDNIISSINEVTDENTIVAGSRLPTNEGVISVDGKLFTVNAPAPKALKTIVARLNINKSPLGKILKQQFGNDAKNILQTVFNGLLNGENPRVVAQTLRNQLQMPLYRAERIARTEILTAYRESNRAMMQNNPSFVKKWVWYANTNSCCAACLAMHGTEHSVNESMGTHPNCRCVQVPKVEPFDDKIDSVITDSVVEQERIKALNVMYKSSADNLQKRFGKSRGYLMSTGKLKLDDLVTKYRDSIFGITRKETTVSDLLKILGVDVSKASGRTLEMKIKNIMKGK